MDLIERQAAIDAIDSYEVDAPDYMQGWAVKLIEAIKGDIRGLISELPSAQPEERTEERTETRACDCISRQTAIDAINSMFAPTPTQMDMKEDCLEIIENLPSAQPEQRWIPCSERLPDKVSDDKYEVMLVLDEDRESVELGVYYDGQWIGLMSRARINVAAWYPLPRLKAWEEEE